MEWRTSYFLEVLSGAAFCGIGRKMWLLKQEPEFGDCLPWAGCSPKYFNRAISCNPQTKRIRFVLWQTPWFRWRNGPSSKYCAWIHIASTRWSQDQTWAVSPWSPYSHFSAGWSMHTWARAELLRALEEWKVTSLRLSTLLSYLPLSHLKQLRVCSIHKWLMSRHLKNSILKMCQLICLHMILKSLRVEPLRIWERGFFHAGSSIILVKSYWSDKHFLASNMLERCASC